MNSASVSVIIPTYERARTVGRAVASVLAALSPGDEVIVVDDGSTDGTESVLAPYRSAIRYVRTENGGAGRARNRGVLEARNPLVAFLDSDDEWEPDRLQLGRRLLARRPDLLFCFSEFGNRAEGRADRHHGLSRWHRDPRSWDEILGPGVWYSTQAELPPGRADFRVHVGNLYANLLSAPYIAVQTLLVRRHAAGESLRFAEELPLYEDWECVARVARRGLGAYLDVHTAWQWHHDGPRLTDADDFVRATARLALVERLWGSDPDFLARHGARVGRLTRDLQIIRAKWLLRFGRVNEARALLAGVSDAPVSLRVVSRAPGSVARSLIGVRSAVKRFGRRMMT